jgi:hypothetical protein
MAASSNLASSRSDETDEATDRGPEVWVPSTHDRVRRIRAKAAKDDQN